MNIDYQICTWQQQQHIMAVRQAVFIEEQNVPEELEIDEHDANCVHILAFENQQPIATARLLNDGHIGRMCVLKSHRLKGIGSNLLQRLIDIAQQQDLHLLQLNAQLDAIPFYEKAGFSVCSDVFLDAGIEHKAMRLKLPNALLKNSHLTIELDSKALCQETVISLISQATDNIALFTQQLEHDLYDHKEICLAIRSLIRSNRRARVRIICQDSYLAAQHGHCLIQLAQKLSSFVEIRQPSSHDIKSFKQSWLMVDDRAYCHIKNLDRFIGTASFNQPLQVKESLDFFNRAWENSETDPQTRRLSL